MSPIPSSEHFRAHVIAPFRLKLLEFSQALSVEGALARLGFGQLRSSAARNVSFE
jgi:hypothetical protein